MYTLIGHELDADGAIVETSAPAYLVPIQDAGLHRYLRRLDIHFFHPHHESYVSVKA